MSMRLAGTPLLAAIALPLAALAQSAPAPMNGAGQFVLTIENHVFSPAEIHVKAGQRSEILVRNLDPTAEEFDSTSLKIEKVVACKSEATLRLRALDPGSYPFIGEYHADTAKGVVIAD